MEIQSKIGEFCPNVKKKTLGVGGVEVEIHKLFFLA